MSDNASNKAPEIAKESVTTSSNAAQVTPAQKLDMEVYAAILGRPPIIDPTLASTVEADAPRPVGELARSWSPISFCLELRRACVDNLMRHAQRQQISDFIRRVSHSASRQVMGTPSGSRFVRSRVADTDRRDRAA
jgi:hypothetical protein